MIQTATTFPIAAAGSARPVSPSAQSGARSFALTLRALSVSGKAAQPVACEAKPGDEALGLLQIAAAPGKDLPPVGMDLAGDEDAPPLDGDADPEAPVGEDVAFAWFALPTATITEATPAGIAPLAGSATVATQLSAAAMAAEGVAVDAEKPPGAPSATDLPQADAGAPPESGMAETSRPANPVDRPSFTLPRAALAAAAPLAPAPAASPSTDMTASALAAGAEMVGAAVQPVADPVPPSRATLLAQAQAAQSASPPLLSPLRRARSEADQPMVTTLAAPGAATLQHVAATPDAQQGALDLRRQEWLGKMIETIETLRDAGPVKQTRISLTPDALGKVDIAVRQEGDRVHVHFTADTQAARQMLTDAQPRLNELAEARGVRLGQTSVDSGQSNANAQSGQRQDQAARPQAPSAPARMRGEILSTDADERIA